MNPESQSNCGKRRRKPKLPELLFTIGGLTSVGLKYVKGQRHADYHKEGACHFEPKLMKRPDNASEHLFQFASHDR
jgi:hypothetical protein